MEAHANYEILEEIGRGEAATVHRARDLNLKRFVAVKELHEKFRRDPRQMEQFWQEAQFLANLEHENVVSVYGIDKERGWIIMELMQGSLDTRLAQGPLPVDLVRSVLRQTLEGLSFLHDRGKLHGAIKPANLLINDLGRVKLSDSAGAVVGGEIRKPLGSHKYLAPELLNPEFGEVSSAVDLYCAGFTALELLRGTKFNDLFAGVGNGAVDPELGWMRWQRSPSERLPPLTTLIPNLPPDLTQVIGKLLEKEVAQRYASAPEALHDLENLPLIAVELPGKTRPVAKVEQTAAAPPAPKPDPKKNSRGGPPLKPWSREWINKKLEDKRILAAVCGGIGLLALAVMFLPLGGSVVPVSVASTPSGAKVFIDDKEQKDPTDTSFKMRQGKHKLRLTLPGYLPLDKDIEVGGRKESRDYSFALEPAPRKVVITSIPSGARVWLDDELKKEPGQSDATLELPSGKKYRLRAQMAGYQVKEEDLKVPPGEEPLRHEIKLLPVAPKPDRPGERFALLAGVRDYQAGVPPYVFADRDIDVLSRTLAVGGWQAKNKVVLKTGGTAPTLAQLRKELALLVADKLPADSVLVALEGYAVYLPEDEGLYFCPADSNPAANKDTLLPLAELYAALQKCRAGLKLVVLDACRSPYQPAKWGTAAKPPEGVAVLFCSAADQESRRHTDWPHSAFMHSVIRALSGEADADQNGQITVEEFRQFVQTEVEQYAKREYPTQAGQKPQFAGRTSATALSKVVEPLLSYSRGCRNLGRRDFPAALEEFTKAIRLDGTFVSALLSRAKVHFYKGAYQAAIKDCDDALRTDDKNAEAYAVRGEAYFKWGGKTEDALRDLTKAIECDGSFPAPYNLRAKVYRANKNYDLAMKDHDAAIERAPDDPYFRNNRGITYVAREEWDKAQRDYEKAIELNPNLSTPYVNMAQMYKKMGNDAKAAEWREKAEKRRSDL